MAPYDDYYIVSDLKHALSPHSNPFIAFNTFMVFRRHG